MDDGEMLLRSILDNPAEDTPRLVYADWLEENAGTVECPQCKGRGENRHGGLGGIGKPCERCGGVQLSPHSHRKGTGTVSDGRRERAEYIRLRVTRDGEVDADIRAVELWKAHVGTWEPLRHTGGTVMAGWRRGFVHTVEDTAAWWLAHGDDLLTRHPVERVRLMTWPRMRVQTMRAMIEDKVGLEDDPQRKMFGATEVAYKAQPFNGHWISAVLALRWPGVTFQLPESSPINANWATSDSNPLADIIAYRERLIREAGDRR